MDYSNFDRFLSRETWHTGHPTDLKVFYQCLSEVVEDQEFSAEGLGEFIRDRKSVDSPDHAFASATDRLVQNAWAVKEYLSR